MKVLIKTYLVTIILILSVTLVAIGIDRNIRDSRLVGRWSADIWTLEFFRDGTGTDSFVGNFSWNTKNGRLTFIWDNYKKAEYFDYSISVDGLFLIFFDHLGVVDIFIRDENPEPPTDCGLQFADTALSTMSLISPMGSIAPSPPTHSTRTQFKVDCSTNSR